MIIVPFTRPEPKPDDRHVTVMVEGGRPVKWFEFSCEFTVADGGKCCFSIWANDHAHAERQIAAVRATATVSGQIFSVIPA